MGGVGLGREGEGGVGINWGSAKVELRESRESAGDNKQSFF